ncbi:MAG: hypothetical protein VB024_11170 [Dysgonamonadaceae bacterium]|mgnify:CR=1 FL=1|jgi:hypothetical protein|nr:hypothetical protein [Dysgonamonadaceae bacterium]MDD3309039.1 hypothetical protein [Dysgonamonadaceae bacterium]MDD3900955.1 hypothetical protein [Dysgonamonadaceae bacterium]MDD4399376.1 hypothetical protein [Dysgonamonadaceae bacterium]MEA5082164.1 hypothetical protein [Dysgonamonadaceae bacterium]
MIDINKQIISHISPFTILFIAIISILSLSKPGGTILDKLNVTAAWWMIAFIILIIFLFSKYYFVDKRNNKNLRFVLLYLLWNIVCIIRGMFVAEIYWDWKGLIENAMALMLPIVAYSATNIKLVQSTLSVYLKYALPLFLIFAFMIRTEAFGFYLMPMSFLLLFLPALTRTQKALVLMVTIVVLIADLGARSNVVKFSIPLLILLIYHFRKSLSVKTIEVIRISLFAIPLILFILGITGVFNIFKMSDYFKDEITAIGTDESGTRSEVDITVDTRTFIYSEVLQSAINNHYWLIGRTPARGNDSFTFGAIDYELTRRNERLGNEVAVANVFTWTGIVGLILYMLIFYSASWLAVNKSKNIYSCMMGILIAFRWFYAWVEDINNFSLNYFMLWLVIGLSISYTFRQMTNKECIIWARGIFDVRYIHYQNYLNKKRKDEKTGNCGIDNLL